MEDATKLGQNRTGIQMSPKDTERMIDGAKNFKPTSGDEYTLAKLRGPYIVGADPLGSVPLPGSMKGMLKSGKEMLTGDRPQAFIDKLSERIAFERNGTRLYDALIEKCQALGDAGIDAPIESLRHFREEEAKHFQMAVAAMEKMGGDPTAQTPSADLVGVESMGLMQAITDPRTTPVQCLHAILVAELADNDGWEMLITLADKMGEREMADEFRTALDEERNHLQHVRTWYQDATMRSASVGS